MEVGDEFDINGYEMVAKIQGAEGPSVIFVVHNNSSHILVAEAPEGDCTKPVYLVKSTPYYQDGDGFKVAYNIALRIAVLLAVRR